METTLNAYHIKVNKCCASCQHKYIEDDGTRSCTLMMLIVQQKFICKQWQMSDGLKNAGLQNGGVVRLKETKEIMIK